MSNPGSIVHQPTNQPNSKQATTPYEMRRCEHVNLIVTAPTLHVAHLSRKLVTESPDIQQTP
jgi:hypothetical protein